MVNDQPDYIADTVLSIWTEVDIVYYGPKTGELREKVTGKKKKS